MQRYFFDLVDQEQVEYDFKGREFGDPKAAFRLAELIALDESMIGSRLGWKVRVSDILGMQLFAIPVIEDPELIAA
jgi:hypothetical protein